ncbi:MAG: leucine-rich repeat domain-containing protein [Bacteroidales bacterium]|nr:leucine-rich repeat domain-containing protein [Bacteroidales bacterium]
MAAVALICTLAPQARAYDFSAIAPSGQTLYYTIIGGSSAVSVSGASHPTGVLTIPSSVSYNGTTYTVTSIPDNAFRSCVGLISVTIPNSVNNIGHGAFSWCSNLSSITIMPGNIEFDSRGNCNAIIESATNRLIAGCKNTVIPNSVTSIYTSAFEGCSGLASVTIPYSIRTIDGYAFYGCDGLTSIVCKGGTPPSLGANNIPTTATITIPCGTTSVYTSSWGSSYTYQEGLPYELKISSSDTTQGTVAIQQQPTCSNDAAIIAATPAIGHHFVRWGDGNTTNPRTIHMTGDTTFVAEFVSNSYTVTAANCLGAGIYAYGSTAIVMAAPQPNMRFLGWADGIGTNPRSITVTSDTTVTPLYAPFGTDTVIMYDTTVVYDTIVNVIHDTTEYNHYFSDTTVVTHHIFDTVRIYDTLTVVNVDTLHHYHYDTIAATRYVFDTVRIYDTLTIVNVDTLYHYHWDTVANTLHHYHYDTTRVFDTITLVSFDTVHHYHYDTTSANHYTFDTLRVYDTLTVFNIDTLHHYHHDTTRVFDTLIVITFDTLHHYHYDTVANTLYHYHYDTTRVFDTLIVVNVDTLHHYHFDTTRVFDTLMVLNIDTLRHYYYDTTRMYDTLTVVNIDTLHHYYFDTTVSVDTLHHYHYDTTRVTNIVYDTTVVTRYTFDTVWMYDTLIIVNIDTLHHHYYDTMIIRTIYDTTSITHYIYTYDTVYIYDTIYMNSNGIDGTAPANMKVYTTRAEIVVEGTEGMPVQLYNISGRLLERRDEGEDRVKFLAPASGTYVLRIGDRTVRKVVVIR